jgi:hypothetical protein
MPPDKPPPPAVSSPVASWDVGGRTKSPADAFFFPLGEVDAALLAIDLEVTEDFRPVDFGDAVFLGGLLRIAAAGGGIPGSPNAAPNGFDLTAPPTDVPLPSPPLEKLVLLGGGGGCLAASLPPNGDDNALPIDLNKSMSLQQRKT